MVKGESQEQKNKIAKLEKLAREHFPNRPIEARDGSILIGNRSVVVGTYSDRVIICDKAYFDNAMKYAKAYESIFENVEVNDYTKQ